MQAEHSSQSVIEPTTGPYPELHGSTPQFQDLFA